MKIYLAGGVSGNLKSYWRLFLPLETKITMTIVGPFVQILIETICLPITTLVKNKLKKIEG